MITNNEVVKRLILHEGLRLKPYRCTRGYLTIGVGRNLQNNPLSINEKTLLQGNVLKEITKKDALLLLQNDIRKHLILCRKNISFFSELSDERQYALLDMCFNLGIKRLLCFKKMLYAMSIGDFQGASKECLSSRYAKEVGNRAKRIAQLIALEKWEV